MTPCEDDARLSTLAPSAEDANADGGTAAGSSTTSSTLSPEQLCAPPRHTGAGTARVQGAAVPGNLTRFTSVASPHSFTCGTACHLALAIEESSTNLLRWYTNSESHMPVGK